MLKSSYIRIGYDVVFVCAFFFVPWWVLVVLGVVGVLMFRSYWELPIIFLIIELLFSVPERIVFSIPFFYTVLGIAGVLFARVLRRRLRHLN